MNYRSLRTGFTLIEVVIAIAILSLIVGGVMASIQACLQTVEIVRRERTIQVQRDALHAFLQRSLLAIPMDTLIRSRHGILGSSAPAALQLRARQPALVFTESPWKPGRTCESVLLWRRQADGSFTLGGGVQATDSAEFLTPEALNADGFPWIPLVRGIRDARWRFYDSSQDLWLDAWEREDSRPSLIELQLEFADNSTPFRGVFWLPNPAIGNAATGRNQPAPNPEAIPNPSPDPS